MQDGKLGISSLHDARTDSLYHPFTDHPHPSTRMTSESDSKSRRLIPGQFWMRNRKSLFLDEPRPKQVIAFAEILQLRKSRILSVEVPVSALSMNAAFGMVMLVMINSSSSGKP